MLQQIFDAGAYDIIRRLGLCYEMAAGALKVLFTRKINAVQSTSAGRLFDAVSAILGIRRASTYEGEAATALMYSAMRGRAHAAGSLASLTELCQSGDSLAQNRQAVEAGGQPQSDVLPTDSLVRALVLAKLDGAGSEELAYEFHRGLAQMIVQETVSLSERTGVKTAALTGGVFQNRLLLELVEKELQAKKIQVLRHHLVPPNDGGIALGQALYAMAALGQENGRKPPAEQRS